MMSQRPLPPLKHALRARRAQRAGVPLAASTLAACAALLLGGCAHTPDSRFFTLSGGTPAATGNAAGTPGAPLATGNPVLIEVLPVNIPGQVSRQQIVATTGTGDVKLEEYNRWASPLADEIGGALSQSLTQSLGAIDSYRTPHPAGATVYRITVNVRQFESVPGERATIDAVWSVVRSSDALTLTCRSTASETVAAGYDNLTAGHRKALARVAADIAQGVRTEQAVTPLPAAMPAPAPAKTATAASGKKKADGQKADPNPAPVTPPAPSLPVLTCPMSASAAS